MPGLLSRTKIKRGTGLAPAIPFVRSVILLFQCVAFCGPQRGRRSGRADRQLDKVSKEILPLEKWCLWVGRADADGQRGRRKSNGDRPNQLL